MSAAERTEPGSWAKSITRAVAGQIRHWRDVRGFSALDLSVKTAELGHEVPRSVIANLENNRRDVITLAEILILSAALEIPPILLMTPLGRSAVIEVLPHIAISPWRVRGWIMGTVDLLADVSPRAGRDVPPSRWRDGRDIIDLFEVHHSLIDEYSARQRQLERALRDDMSGIDDWIKVLDYTRQRLINHRALMRRLELAPPDLPAAIANILDEADTS